MRYLRSAAHNRSQSPARLFPDDAACAANPGQKGSRPATGLFAPMCQAAGEPCPLRKSSWRPCAAASAAVTASMVETVMARSHTPLSVWFWSAYLVSSQTPGVAPAVQLRQVRPAVGATRLIFETPQAPRGDGAPGSRTGSRAAGPVARSQTGLRDARQSGRGSTIRSLPQVEVSPARSAGTKLTSEGGALCRRGFGLRHRAYRSAELLLCHGVRRWPGTSLRRPTGGQRSACQARLNTSPSLRSAGRRGEPIISSLCLSAAIRTMDRPLSVF